MDDWGLSLLGAALRGGIIQKHVQQWPQPDQTQPVCSESQQASSPCLSEGKKNIRVNGTSKERCSHSCVMPKQHYQNSRTSKRSREVLPLLHRGPVRTHLLIKTDFTYYKQRSIRVWEIWKPGSKRNWKLNHAASPWITMPHTASLCSRCVVSAGLLK